MYCPYCGAHLVDGAKFCNTCGKGIEWPEGFEQGESKVTQDEFAAFQAEQEAKEKAEYEAWKQSRAAAFEAQQQQPTVETVTETKQETVTGETVATEKASDEERAEAKNAMILAIIGAALSELGLPGLILSLVARKRVINIQKKYGKIRGMAVAAKWCALGGKIVGIFMTVFWALWFFAVFATIIAAIYTRDGSALDSMRTTPFGFTLRLF